MDVYNIDELKALREQLRSEHVSEMTVGELKDHLDRLCDTERRIAAIEQCSGYAQAAQYRNAAGTGQVFPHGAASGAGQAPGYRYDGLRQNVFRNAGKEHRKKNTEQAVGRYAMTVLAAVLCLLALVVFVMSFWQAMPDPVKFGLVMLFGAGFEVAGFHMSGKSNMRAFWLGVAGLGAGVSFIDIAAGCLAWDLYGTALAGVLVLVWVVANFWLGQKQSCGMFHIIAYAGGILAIAMGKYMAYGTVSEIVLMALSTAVIVSGLAGYRKEKRPYLAFMNILFCLAAGRILAQPAYFASLDTGPQPGLTFNRYYPGAVTGWYCAALGMLCLYHIRKLEAWNGRIGDLGVFPQAVLAAACCMYAGSAFDGLELPGAWGMILAAICVAAFGFKSANGYLLGASIPFGLMLQSISVQLGFSDAFLISAASCAACAMYYRLKTDADRVSVWILYIMAMLSGMHADDGRFAVCCLAAAFLAVGLVLRQLQCKSYGLYVCEPLEKLAAFVIPGILCTVFADAGLVPDVLPPAVISAGLQAYWIAYLRNAIPSVHTGTARVLWRIMRSAAYLGILASVIFADDATKIVITISLMLTLAFNVYQAVRSEGRAQSVAACLMANWHLHLLAGIYGFGSYQIAISLLGMGVSAASVLGGFILDRKGLRQAGLGCVILYALKLGLIDVSGGGLGTAGGLLLAGAICFGVSLAYNKLGRIYTRQDGSDV